MSKDNSGSAFPIRQHYDEATGHYIHYADDGMSLRDYFAASAVKGFTANPMCNPETQQHFNNLAEDAYRLADAMIAERNKESK